MAEVDSTIEYREIPEYPNYRVGSDGSVWTRIVRGSQKGRIGPWWEMTLASNRGYRVVNLRKDGKTKLYQVHRLVLLAFVGPCPERMECRHLDGNPSNNNLENICWGTFQENCKDKIRHGTVDRGEKKWNAILTESQVLEIKKKLSQGIRQVALAQEYKVHPNTIRSIFTGQSWSWLKES